MNRISKKFGNVQKQSLQIVVSPIVASPAFEIKERDILLQALENFHYLNIDFIDAYIGAWMKEQNLNDIFTFNLKDFKRIPLIRF